MEAKSTSQPILFHTDLDRNQRFGLIELLFGWPPCS